VNTTGSRKVCQLNQRLTVTFSLQLHKKIACIFEISKAKKGSAAERCKQKVAMLYTAFKKEKEKKALQPSTKKQQLHKQSCSQKREKKPLTMSCYMQMTTPGVNLKASGMSHAYTTPCYNYGSHTLESLCVWSI
jgi:hypothetical protein